MGIFVYCTALNWLVQKQLCRDVLENVLICVRMALLIMDKILVLRYASTNNLSFKWNSKIFLYLLLFLSFLEIMQSLLPYVSDMIFKVSVTGFHREKQPMMLSTNYQSGDDCSLAHLFCIHCLKALKFNWTLVYDFSPGTSLKGLTPCGFWRFYLLGNWAWLCHLQQLHSGMVCQSAFVVETQFVATVLLLNVLIVSSTVAHLQVPETDLKISWKQTLWWWRLEWLYMLTLCRKKFSAFLFVSAQIFSAYIFSCLFWVLMEQALWEWLYRSCFRWVTCEWASEWVI